MNNNYLYIVLTRTETKPAQIIRLITRKPYSHVSITSDKHLTHMYSFCRDYKETPLPAHFNIEHIDTEIFGMQNDIPCEIYRIKVTDEQYEKYDEIINHFTVNRTYYCYNIAALLSMALHIPYRFKNKFVCSVWVGFVLYKIGIKNFTEKHPSLITPEDFRHVPDSELVYIGNLKEYQDFLCEKVINDSNKPIAFSKNRQNYA